MSRPQKPTLNHRFEFFVYRAVEQSLRLLSIETTYRLGSFAGSLAHRFLPAQRRKVIRNLRFAFGDEKSRPEIADLAARVFERTGANLFSSIRLPFLNNEQIKERVEFAGLEEVLAIAGRQGIVAVSPHMGNWELLAQAAYLAEGAFEAATHYRPLNNSLLNALVERRRKKRGLKLFAKRSSGHAMASFVKQGGFLGILADQRVGARGFPGVFFGRPTTCSPLPDLMARRGNGRLFSLVCETIGVARWKISLTSINKINAQACADSLEQAWRRSPEDVFWFEDRWRLQGKNRLSFLEKYPTDHSATRPLRLVNLAPSEVTPPPLPPSLVTVENHPLNLARADPLIKQELDNLSEQGSTPVDVFVVPEAQVRNISRMTGKTLVFSGIPV